MWELTLCFAATSIRLFSHQMWSDHTVRAALRLHPLRTDYMLHCLLWYKVVLRDRTDCH